MTSACPNFTHGANVTHAHALLGFLALMDDESFDPTNPENFQTVVDQAVNRYDIAPGEIATHFEFHASTPSRWLNNKSLPQPVVRRLVVDFLASSSAALPAVPVFERRTLGARSISISNM